MQRDNQTIKTLMCTEYGRPRDPCYPQQRQIDMLGLAVIDIQQNTDKLSTRTVLGMGDEHYEFLEINKYASQELDVQQLWFAMETMLSI